MGHPVRECDGGGVQEDAFEEVYKAQFIAFLAAVPPWFTLDINQGVLTLRLARSDPSAFAAEVYGAALGEAVADDFKYNFGHNVLQAALTVLRCKAHGRADVDVCPCSHIIGLPYLKTRSCILCFFPGALCVETSLIRPYLYCRSSGGAPPMLPAGPRPGVAS